MAFVGILSQVKLFLELLGAACYSACVVYTKTIIHFSVGESDGYLPRHFVARQISTTIHLHFGE